MDRPSQMALLGALLLATAPAGANGRYPESQLVEFGPGTLSSDIALRVTFGFALSGDSGQSFQWLCECPLGYGTEVFDPGYALDATGELLVGVEDGAYRVSRDRCTFTRIDVMAGEYVRDLDTNPTAMTIVAATDPSDITTPAHIYRSDDGGQSFVLAGPGMVGAQYQTIEVTPNDTQRVYLSGTLGSASTPTLFRSDDGGASVYTLPTPPGMQSLWIAGTDPSLEDTVYVRANLATPVMEGSVVLPTALLRSDDGGHTWRELTRTTGPMAGFAVGADGQTLWTGGTTAMDGIQRSMDGGRTWQLLHPLPVLCLAQHGGALWVCADDHVAGFALARSNDEGETLDSVLSFTRLQPPVNCPNPSPELALCSMDWASQQYLIGQRPAVSMDAGNGAENAAPSACGCRVGVRASPWNTRGCALWIALVLHARRRIRRGMMGQRQQ